MRRAVIDLGTNTFNLLIADVLGDTLSIVHHDKHAVMLGMGGINQGYIAPDALQRGKEALRIFKTRCSEFQTSSISAIGTSALRGASNSADLIQFAKNELDIHIQIVSGMDEATLIYHGVRLTHDFSHAAMIMDIGGGSTEFIYADKAGPKWSESYDIGVSRIYQFLGEPDEFGPQDFEKIRQYLEEKSGEQFPQHAADHLIGSSGTFETLYEMLFEQAFPDTGEALELPLTALKDVLHWSKSASLQERVDNPWIIPMRKRMLPIAAVKILWILEKWSINRVWVSPYSLKEGALLTMHAGY